MSIALLCSITALEKQIMMEKQQVALFLPHKEKYCHLSRHFQPFVLDLFEKRVVVII